MGERRGPLRKFQSPSPAPLLPLFLPDGFVFRRGGPPPALAFSTDRTLWVTNQGNGTVTRLTAAGASYGTPYSLGATSQPRSIAFDSLGTAWVANSGNASVSTISNAGAVTNSTPSGASSPLAISVNPH